MERVLEQKKTKRRLSVQVEQYKLAVLQIALDCKRLAILRHGTALAGNRTQNIFPTGLNNKTRNINYKENSKRSAGNLKESQLLYFD